ncbi:hypothetical protein D917_09337, partial [Trichinella nativa]
MIFAVLLILIVLGLIYHFINKEKQPAELVDGLVDMLKGKSITKLATFQLDEKSQVERDESDFQSGTTATTVEIISDQISKELILKKSTQGKMDNKGVEESKELINADGIKETEMKAMAEKKIVLKELKKKNTGPLKKKFHSKIKKIKKILKLKPETLASPISNQVQQMEIVKMEKVESNHDFRKRRIEEASDTKMPKMKIIPCRDEIDEQPEVKELKAVIFKGRVEAAAFTAIPYEKVVDRAAEEVTIQDKKKKKKKSKTKSKFKISTKDSKKAMEKEDSSPLKAEIKAELEIKKLKNDGMDKEMETEEIKLVVEEKNDEEDGKDEGDAEINDEKKKNSKENAKSKKSKNKSKKTDFIPLKVEVKSEPEMKEIMHNNKNEGMETKEEAPEAQEKVTEEVNKAAEEVEIKGEKKKNNSNKKSNSKNGEKKEIAVTPQIRKIPSKDIAEMQPVKNEVNADI